LVYRCAEAGDFVVIVNKANTAKLDKGTVAKIYLGDIRSWPDGTPTATIDLPESNSTRIAFYREVVGKSVANMKAIWSRLIFSGKALPPKQVANDDEVKKAVASATGGLGYINATAMDATVRKVLD
jgi:ABC-type phosphate transport system substrate-binding protein